MIGETRSPVLGEVIAVLDRLYDPAWAREWDRVGLVCGDPMAPVRRVLLAIDPVSAVVDEALEWNADLVITHHPLLMESVNSVAADTVKGRLLHRLIKGDCALFTTHTNADVAAPGVSDALARVLGLRDLVPLVPDPPDPIDKIVTVVAAEAVDEVIDAMAKAGAGELGQYSRCAFVAAGNATFIPPAQNQLGQNQSELSELGQRRDVTEQRLEMVCPRAQRAQVLAALRNAHPAEQPPVDVYELVALASTRGLGRVGRLANSTTLREFALLVAEALPATAQGIRIAGEPSSVVNTIAVCGGSGADLIPAARAAGVDAFVTADLRHHLTSQAREVDGEGKPYLLDVAHWASEWPWLAGVANRLGGLLEAAGTPVEVSVSSRCTDPWTFRVPSAGGVVR